MTMSNWYLRTVGKLGGLTLGRLDSYTEEHSRFLASGYECQRCHRCLMKWLFWPTVYCLSADDQRVPMRTARLSGRRFQCPHCEYSWPVRTEGVKGKG